MAIEVPVNEVQVRPRGVSGNISYDTRVNTEAITQPLQQGAALAQQLADKAREEADDTVVNQFRKENAEWESANIFNPANPDSAAAQQGPQANALTNRYAAKYSDFYEQWKKRVSTDRQAKLVEREYIKNYDRLHGNLTQMEGKQYDAIQESASDGAVDGAISTGANEWDNVVAREEAYKAGRTEVEAKLERKGYKVTDTDDHTKKVREAEIRRYNTRFHMGVAERMKEASPTKTLEYLTKHLPEMNGSDKTLINLLNGLNGAKDEEEALSVVSAIKDETDDYAEQQKSLEGFARKKYISDKVYKSAFSMLKMQHDENERALDAADDDRYEQVRQGLLLTRQLHVGSVEFRRLNTNSQNSLIAEWNAMQGQLRASTSAARTAQKDINDREEKRFMAMAPELRRSINVAKEFWNRGIDPTGYWNLMAMQQFEIQTYNAGLQVPEGRFQDWISAEIARTPTLAKSEQDAKDFRHFMEKWRIDQWNANSAKGKAAYPTYEETKEAIRKYLTIVEYDTLGPNPNRPRWKQEKKYPGGSSFDSKYVKELPMKDQPPAVQGAAPPGIEIRPGALMPEPPPSGREDFSGDNPNQPPVQRPQLPDKVDTVNQIPEVLVPRLKEKYLEFHDKDPAHYPSAAPTDEDIVGFYNELRATGKIRVNRGGR